MKAYLVLFLSGALGLGFAAGAASAETLSAKISMKAANEVPPNDSLGTGEADVNLDTATRVLTWSVTYSGLTGPASAAHFHGPAEPGKNAGVVVPFTNVATSPIKGTATVTQDQATDIAAGKWYVNVHTAQHPGGEIRGQVTLK